MKIKKIQGITTTEFVTVLGLAFILILVIWFLIAVFTSSKRPDDTKAVVQAAINVAQAALDANTIVTNAPEYPEGQHTFNLPPDRKLLSIDCSLGELHILTKPRTMLEQAQTYEYTGYNASGTNAKIASYTIIEN